MIHVRSLSNSVTETLRNMYDTFTEPLHLFYGFVSARPSIELTMTIHLTAPLHSPYGATRIAIIQRVANGSPSVVLSLKEYDFLSMRAEEILRAIQS